jgi:glutamate synthase (NADPH/NADH) large chain
MSGGMAFVYNPDGLFEQQCNKDTFEIEEVSSETDMGELKKLIQNHLDLTQSKVAKKLLLNWKLELKNFSKVIPTDYKRVLEEIQKEAV